MPLEGPHEISLRDAPRVDLAVAPAGKDVGAVRGTGGSVKSLAFSRDGKYLASGSFDKTIKLWLTPWEAEARNNEIQKAAALEAEKNKNYSLHY